MKVILATGGTGGHIFPAVALGQELERTGHDVLFVGSGRPLDRQVESSSGMRWKQLKVGRLKGMGFLNKCQALLMIPYACVQALIVLIAEKPDLVIGVGGSASGPMVLMARFVAIKTAILESNSIPGLTNRLLSRFVNRIFIALPTIKYFDPRKRKVCFTGNPIRTEVIEQFETAAKENNRFTLLVMGGSQGAHFLNELMLRLLPDLGDIAGSLRIIHVTGAADFNTIQAAYQAVPELEAVVQPFVNEIGLFYKQADLVLSRSGAATISDLIQFGLPAVLVPYPFAADQHQVANANYLSQAGAAVVKLQQDLEPATFGRLLRDWIRNRAPLQQMAQNARALAPEAPAQRIIEDCQQMVFGHV